MLKLIQAGLVAVVIAMGVGTAWAGAVEDNDKGVDYSEAGNYREAVKWYRKAAGQGHTLAQYNLGVMYRNGEGVPLDDREAVKWWRKAAL